MKINEWITINEEERTYIWPDFEISVKNTKSLKVSDSGGHRLETHQGVNYYIPPGWVALKFVGEWVT